MHEVARHPRGAGRASESGGGGSVREHARTRGSSLLHTAEGGRGGGGGGGAGGGEGGWRGFDPAASGRGGGGGGGRAGGSECGGGGTCGGGKQGGSAGDRAIWLDYRVARARRFAWVRKAGSMEAAASMGAPSMASSCLRLDAPVLGPRRAVDAAERRAAALGGAGAGSMLGSGQGGRGKPRAPIEVRVALRRQASAKGGKGRGGGGGGRGRCLERRGRRGERWFEESRVGISAVRRQAWVRKAGCGGGRGPHGFSRQPSPPATSGSKSALMPAAGVRFEGGRCGRVAGRGGKGGGTFAELAPPRSALQARPRAGQPGARQRPEGHFLTRAVAVEDAGGHLREQRRSNR